MKVHVQVRARKGVFACLFGSIPQSVRRYEAFLLTAAKQPGAAPTPSIALLYFPPKCTQVRLICPATTNDILKSVLIFLPESSRNSQRPPTPTPLPVYQVYIDAILLGLNCCNRTQYFKPLATQPIHPITECSVIITAKGNVHASLCVCVWGEIHISVWPVELQTAAIDARNRQIVGRNLDSKTDLQNRSLTRRCWVVESGQDLRARKCVRAHRPN